MPVPPLKSFYVLICAAVTAAIMDTAAPAALAERYEFHHEHVLGTSLEIQLEAASLDAASKAEKRILDEIERMSKIVSSYDESSELRRWQTQINTPTKLSPELSALLAASDQWRERSGGAFNPSVEPLTLAWQVAAKTGTLPADEELAKLAAQINKPRWTLDLSNQTATRLDTYPISLNAIAKGAIIDRACRAAMVDDAVTGALVCIGGDLRAAGDITQPIHVADPKHDAVNAKPLSTVFVNGRGLATSGNYRRGFNVGGRHYSHIFDPRIGRPVDHITSATVIANSAEDADAVATIMSVLQPEESLKLAKSLADVEFFLVTSDGKQVTSDGWDELTSPQLFRFTSATIGRPQEGAKQEAKTNEVKKDEAKDALLELVVNFELDKPTGAQYRRPYLAVWLEDADEFPVRTGVLWMQTKQPGPRWHRDLLRWYRNDSVRKLADKTDLIGTISSATRGPGQYKVAFDGKDDAGKPLPPGKYTLLIEAAREHGTYQLIRQPLTLGAEPIKESKLKGNVEIKSASYEYRAPVDDKQPAK